MSDLEILVIELGERAVIAILEEEMWVLTSLPYYLTI
jgi:hypothetical protein